jgi:hypothetical protein
MINAVIFLAIMIRVIRVDFLSAMAARFGYDSNGSDVRCGVLPQSFFKHHRDAAFQTELLVGIFSLIMI